MNVLNNYKNHVTIKKAKWYVRKKRRNKRVKKYVFGAIVTLFLFSIGCSNEGTQGVEKIEDEREESVSDTETEKVQEEEFSYALFDEIKMNDTEAWMKVGPGEYAGDGVDISLLKEKINDWPSGLDAETYFRMLLHLTAEDFRPYQEYLEETEVVFSDITARPGELVTNEEGEKRSLRVQVLLDASGSMAGQIEGKVKMDIAKEAIEEFASTLPEGAELSLRVYGHAGSNQPSGKEESCTTTEVVYPFRTYDEEAFHAALHSIVPTGYTPITLAIEEAADDLLSGDNDNVEHVIYVVSDGEETCGGDPVEATKELVDSDIHAVVNIIGFDISSDERKALEAIAEAGNGEYFKADNERELKETFRKEKTALISEWRQWQNENIVTSRKEQTEYVSTSRQLQNEAITLSRVEQQRLLELSHYLQENKEADGPSIRNFIRERGISMREYMREQFLLIREEAREQGLKDRDAVRREGLERRDEIRQRDE